MNSRDETRATHEAGHAVIARVLGVIVTHVALFQTDETSGAGAQTYNAVLLARDNDVAAYARGIEVNAKIALAGPHAQAKLRPNINVKRARRDEWRCDLELVESCVGTLAWMQDHARLPSADDDGAKIALSAAQMAEASRINRRLNEETRALVEEHWPAIERVAKALLKLRALHGAEVDDLIKAQP